MDCRVTYVCSTAAAWRWLLMLDPVYHPSYAKQITRSTIWLESYWTVIARWCFLLLMTAATSTSLCSACRLLSLQRHMLQSWGAEGSGAVILNSTDAAGGVSHATLFRTNHDIFLLFRCSAGAVIGTDGAARCCATAHQRHWPGCQVHLSQAGSWQPSCYVILTSRSDAWHRRLQSAETTAYRVPATAAAQHVQAARDICVSSAVH